MWTLAIEFIKNGAGWLYEKLGFLGCLLILSLIGMGVQHLEIKHEKAEVAAGIVRIDALVSDVKTQNEAIDLVSSQRDALQKALDSVVITNNALSVTVAGYRGILNKEPIQNTCDGAINEISMVATKTAIAWNTGVLP